MLWLRNEKKPTKTEYFKSGYEFGHSKRVIRMKNWQ